jgi:hypothetical protein
MADAPKPVPPEDKRPPEYDDEMERRARDKAKAAYDKISPLGKSIPPMPIEKKAKGGSIRGGNISAKYMSFSKTGKPAGMKPVTKMARGGKTKGRMV